MIKRFIIVGFALCLITSCGSDQKEISAEEKEVIDSISKANQRRKVDSLKKLNPLLILPPDSTFTGDYIDKYPNGIIKYTGFFRFGQRHGQWVSFYPTGIPWSEQSYDKGKRQGANVVYYENSKLRYKGFFKNDKRDSVWMFYDSTGKLLQTMMFRNDNEIPISSK
jgi:antitoxin component YwqK of YwqJK toxin-antitoxin module